MRTANSSGSIFLFFLVTSIGAVQVFSEQNPAAGIKDSQPKLKLDRMKRMRKMCPLNDSAA